jgi:dihydroflavonol-4-reductase
MIAVTGATGHIGNVLVRQLLTEEEQIRAVVLPGEDLTPLKGLKVEIVAANVLDKESINTALSGASLVYHLAGLISILPGNKQILEKVNVCGTRNVVEACVSHGIKRLVYVSSIHALAETPRGQTITEDQPFDPQSVLGDYAKSKASASLEVFKGIQQGLDAVIVCPTGVIGPFDYKGSEMGHLIQSFVRHKLPAGVNGAYDFIDVRDVAAGMRLAAQKGERGEVYILSGEQIKIRRLFQILEQISGTHAPHFVVPCWLAKIVGIISTPLILHRHQKPLFTAYSIDVLRSNSLVSSDKAKKQLGFNPRPLFDSLCDTIAWFKERTQTIPYMK